jgi:hypothetical protein
MQSDITIVNTERHTKAGLLVSPFDTDGSAHLTPFKGERPGNALILDRGAVRELRDLLTEILESAE